jgi:transposase
MPRRLTLINPLSTEEFEHRHQNSSRPVEKRNWHVLWLFSREKKTEEIADFLGITVEWVRLIIRKYNEQGEKGMEDKRKNNKGGNPPLLTSLQMEKLSIILQKPPPDGGIWSGPKVALWMGQELGREVSRKRAWEYLKKNGV